MKTNRGLIKYLVLSALTCGIYSLVFYHALARDMNRACGGDGKHTRGLLAYIVLSMLTCGIYSLVWHYGVCERVALHCYRRSKPAPVDGGSFLLWSLIGALLCGLGPLIAIHKMLMGVNLVCMDYNNAHPYDAMNYGIY